MATRRRATSEQGQAPTIAAWSFSRWHTYETCPRQARYKYIDKLPDPSGPAAQRGSEIHEQAERFVAGHIVELPNTLRRFSDEFAELRRSTRVEVEQQWAFTADWQPTDWFASDTWCRMKVDVVAFVKHDRKSAARIIDHKTGREREHHEKQFELYALGAFVVLPQIQVVLTENWYLDQGDIVDRVFEASEIDALKQLWQRRTSDMLTDRLFAAHGRPHVECRWCAFAKSKGGPCERG